MQRIKLLSPLIAAAALLVAAGGPAAANTDDVRPVFNHKADVAFVIDDEGNREVRDEADFLRFGLRGQHGNGDDVDFCSDQTLDLWFYVHNGTSELTNSAAGNWASGDIDNGDPFWNAGNSDLDGPSVAKNTAVRLAVPGESSGSHVVTAHVTSDNSDEVSDSVQISCSDDSKQISLVYVEEETMLSTRAPEHGTLGTFNLIGNLTSESGAVLGYGQDSQGIVPSCFDFAAVIRGKLKVVVTEDTTVDEDGSDQTPDEVPGPGEDTPEDIPDLGAGAAPLAAIALSSVLGAVGYRTVQSTRR